MMLAFLVAQFLLAVAVAGPSIDQILQNRALSRYHYRMRQVFKDAAKHVKEEDRG